jgi:hypothetical protein
MSETFPLREVIPLSTSPLVHLNSPGPSTQPPTWSTPTRIPSCECPTGPRSSLTPTDPSNDALRAHGILPPKPPSRSPSPDIPHITHADAVQAIAATATADQLDLLLEGEGIDSDDERMFEEYRRKRMNEMKKEEKRGRYGSMEPLSREDFVKEVTEGSRISPETGLPEVDEEPGEDSDEEERGMTRAQGLKGTGVVVFLYKDS